jgi:hypothetical protein
VSKTSKGSFFFVCKRCFCAIILTCRRLRVVVSEIKSHVLTLLHYPVHRSAKISHVLDAHTTRPFINGSGIRAIHRWVTGRFLSELNDSLTQLDSLALTQFTHSLTCRPSLFKLLGQQTRTEIRKNRTTQAITLVFQPFTTRP